jgi:hypothetical protein
MSGITGREVRMAFAKFGTGSWGVPASVLYGPYFSSDGGLTLKPARVNDDAFGQSFMGDGDLGDVEAPNLTLSGRSRYDDYGYIFDALAMGSPTAPTISTSVVSQTTSYQHIIDLAPNIDGLGFTAAIDKVLFVDELTSAKVYGFGESIGDGGVMDRAYKVLGSKPTNDSTTNSRSTVNGAAYPALSNRIFRKQGTWRMNARLANSLVASDAIKIEAWSLEFERPQDAPHVFGQDYVMEPADNGWPVVKITVQYPRMTSISANSLYEALKSDGQFKADMTFLGTFINSTDKYKRLYEFPFLELDEWAAPLAGANQVKPSASFMAKLSGTSLTPGMTVTNPFRLTLINTQALAAF